MIKVSFDYDGTLGLHKSIQKYAKELVDDGHEVHIVTRRYDDPDKYGKLFCQVYGIKDIGLEHKELFDVALECGILKKNIHFMNMSDKFEFFVKNAGFLWHLDDDNVECNDINKHTDTIGISCSNGANWKDKCDRFIKKKLNGR